LGTASRNALKCLLTFLFKIVIARLKFPGPRLPLRLVSGPYIFLSPPTHSSLPTPCYLSRTHLYTILSGRGGPLEGFIRPLHRPSPRGAVDLPSTPSVHPVDYRLDSCSYLSCDCGHPQDNKCDGRFYHGHTYLQAIFKQSSATSTSFPPQSF